MIEIFLQALYFFLPAYFANMAPVMFKKLPILEKSINKKALGKNKTWRGLILGIFFGTFVFYLQQLLYAKEILISLALIDYNGHPLLLGLALAIGALLGDLIESYFKRKNKIKPGKPWIPYDQLDFVVGALLLSSLFYVPRVEAILIILMASPLLHVLVNHIGFYLGIRKAKF